MFENNLKLFKPDFDSSLLDAIIELEHLRRVRLEGTTPAFVFSQLKDLFRAIESLGSARIEGNRTTLSRYLAAMQAKSPVSKTEQIQEIKNIEEALAYIDEYVKPGENISSRFIRELQQCVVKGLTAEGDANAGAYRYFPVRIAGSEHTPPQAFMVQELMDDLIAFINRKDPPKYDLIKVALVHHRFGWIHPFGSGNGRTVRLLTYAMLLKYGFNGNATGRILNPTTVFCCDRDHYYDMLSQANAGTPEGIEAWCQYVLTGLQEGVQKMDALMNYEQVKEMILMPAVKNAFDKGLMSRQEKTILELAIQKKTISVADVVQALGIKSPAASYRVKKLNEQDFLEPIQEGKRQYRLKLSSTKMIYGIVDALDHHQFIPRNLLKDA